MTVRTAFVLTALTLTLVLPTSAQSPQVTHGQAIYHDTSAPMRDMAVLKPAPAAADREVPIQVRPDFGRSPEDAAPDGGLQTSPDVASLGPTPAPRLSVPGLSEQDNVDVAGGAIVPPDANGDIGLDGAGNKVYVQYINLVWGVFRAGDGALIAGPFVGNSFWAGFGGFCEANNNGDPVVLYDDRAGRWFFSQFSINQGIQCVAVSATGDPLGPYHRYAFEVTPGGSNDYPKLGVWDDGTSGSTGQSAYTFTMRDFGGVGGAFSVSAGVMERDAMLVGAPASFVKFSNACVAGDCIEGQLPPHLAGPPPPAGTCPTYWAAVDAAYDNSPFSTDGYRNHTLCVDWSDPASSTYSEGPLVAAGSNFDRFLVGGFSDCISPVGGGEDLDCLAAFTMFRAQYRWFGIDARVVLNTTVDAGNDRAGIRWAEARSADGDSGWFLRQDGTYAPGDGLERWMGSIAQDQDGNIALGYSVAGPTLFPSVRYTSRMAADAPGVMAGGEVSCHEAAGAQVGSANRWGDYSSMSVDPVDDCTFWYTQEYYENTGSFDFSTRICSFKFPFCINEVCDEIPEVTCDDGLDNDCDGDFDCFDDDCSGTPPCITVCEPEVCTNFIDDDCDGFIDCFDPDCAADPACLQPEPPNDDCDDAIGPLAVGSITSGSTAAATPDEPPDIDCGTSVTAPGVWYTVTGTGNTMTASTCNDGDPSTGGAGYDTKISVYCADCEVKECIGGQDDDLGQCAGFSTKLSWPTRAGATYSVLVHGFGSGTGDFDLAILDDGVPTTGANDCDGIPDAFDVCLGTRVPESVPTTGELAPNNSALTDGSGVFETAPPEGEGSGTALSFTLEDTGGCSCEQIVDALHLGTGHLQHGCSPGAMQNWVTSLEE